jgi:predicted nuclease of predicted toxin-antitoxin system
LYDELLPWRVAESLRALEYRVSYVGDNEQPPRGSPDEEVLDHARKTNQVVVTSNHDMIMLCAEVGESVIWLDPRGRQLRREEHVVLAFTNIAQWQELLLQADAQVCVRALRTKNEVLTLERAFTLAERRVRALRARKRSRARSTPSQPNALFDEDQ